MRRREESEKQPIISAEYKGGKGDGRSGDDSDHKHIKKQETPRPTGNVQPPLFPPSGQFISTTLSRMQPAFSVFCNQSALHQLLLEK